MHDVETTFGTVRAYAWLNPTPVGDVPVVLVPGRASGVPMWGEKLPHGTVKVWPKTTHSLPMRVAAELDAELERFWADVR